jgi:hypothetical protein
LVSSGTRQTAASRADIPGRLSLRRGYLATAQVGVGGHNEEYNGPAKELTRWVGERVSGGGGGAGVGVLYGIRSLLEGGQA